VNPLPLAEAGSDRAICLNESTTIGSAQVTGSTYSWSSDPSGFSSTESNPTVSPAVTTTYTVVETITETGCTNTNSVVVTVNPLPQAEAGADRAICLNESTTIGAAQVTGSTYSWSSDPSGFSSTEADPTVSPTETTTYTVVETITETGCINTNSVEVTVNPLPLAEAGADRAICLNESTTIGAAQVTGSTYSWSSDPSGFSSTEADPTVSPTETTTYTVVETITETGCINTNSVVVTVKPIPVLSSTLTPEAICSAATFDYTATSGTTGSTFAWSRATISGITEPGSTGTGDVSEVLTNTTTAPIDVTYVYVITADGCSNTGQDVVVTVNPTPQLSSTLTPAEICNGSTFVYTASSATSGSTFAWSRATIAGITEPGTSGTGDVSEVLTNTTTAPIDVTYVYLTTANGCSNTGQDVVVTVNPTPVLSSTLTPPAINSGATFNYTATSVTPGATFGWSRATIAGIEQAGTSGTGNVSEVLTNTVTVPVNVTYVYTTTINGCGDASQEVVVTVYPTADLSSTLTPPDVCSMAPFNYIATSATPGATFAWTRPTVAGIFPGGTSGTGNVSEVLLNTTTDPIVVTYIYTTTANGYSNTPQDVVVTINPTPVLSSSLTPPPVCSGSTFVYTATSATTGAVFGWTRATIAGIAEPGTNGAGNVSEVLTNTTSSPISVTYVYTTTANNCSSAGQNVVVSVKPVVPVSMTIAPSSNPSVADQDVTFTASPVNGGSGPSYQWMVNGFNAGTNSSAFTYKPVNSDEVTCVLTSSESCVSGNPAISNTVIMTVTGVPVENITVTGNVSGVQTKCYNSLGTITVAGAGTTFIVNNGGSATMIAGQNIFYLPGTTVQPGGYMHGFISTTENCGVKSPAIVNTVTSTEEQQYISQKSSFKLYPNPATGKFTLELIGKTTFDNVKVELFGMTGEKLMTGEMNGEKKHEFRLSELPYGIYVVKVLAGDKVETFKLVITR